MAFDLRISEVPNGLTTDAFVLRPITADDAELDHAAVMDSREHLRLWEQSSWPEDDFTIAANREDLVEMEERHIDRRAFGFTMLDPAGTECLGCVYLMPVDASMFDGASITPVGDHLWESQDVAVYFWVRSSRLATGLDRELLDALRCWLGEEWEFARVLFVTSEPFTQQVAMIDETDLELRFHVEERGKPGRHLAYG